MIHSLYCIQHRSDLPISSSLTLACCALCADPDWKASHAILEVCYPSLNVPTTDKRNRNRRQAERITGYTARFLNGSIPSGRARLLSGDGRMPAQRHVPRFQELDPGGRQGARARALLRPRSYARTLARKSRARLLTHTPAQRPCLTATSPPPSHGSHRKYVYMI